MNKVEVESAISQQTDPFRERTLAPFMRLETGSLVTIRMRGHTHSPGGLEYFAPAVVLAQYNDDYGSIDCLVWDSSAGNAYVHGYHVRELGVRGEGSEREMYELQSNIGQVLFSPDQLANVISRIDQLEYDMLSMLTAVSKMQIAESAKIPAHVATEDKSQKAQPSGKSSSGA